MKVLLTNPPFYGENFHAIRAGCRWPFIFNSPKPAPDTPGAYNTYPFFMGYASAYLIAQGVGDVYFYDALARAHTYEQFYGAVSEVKPDITVIETSTPSILNDMGIAAKIKAQGSEIALCGPHATVFADDLIKLPYVDYVLQGEYEIGAYEMCLTRKKKVYRCRPIRNIDTIPRPVRIPGEVYLYGDGFSHEQSIAWPQLQVWGSRGCPYQCNFCLWKDTMTFGRYRQRSVRSIIREITSCMRDFQYKSVLFDDDTFNVGDQRTRDIAFAMDNIEIQWHAMVRADACNWETFRIMRECGCVGLKVGVESFSENGLKSVCKGYNKTGTIETIDYLVSLGFKVYLSTMDNIVGETESDRQETQKWLDYFHAKGVRYQRPNCMPLPGTQLYKALDSQGMIDKSDWKKYGMFYEKVVNEKIGDQNV